MELSKDERLLNAGDRSRDLRSKVARSEMASRLGAALESEKASFSDEFGYVYRYKIDRQKSGLDGPDGVLAIWTDDGETFRFVTFSGFELPK